MYDSALHNPAIFEHNMGARDFRVWFSTKSRSRKEMIHQFLLGANIYIPQSYLRDSLFDIALASHVSFLRSLPNYSNVVSPDPSTSKGYTVIRCLGDGINTGRSCKLQGENRRIAALYRGLHLFVEIMSKKDDIIHGA